MPRRNNLIAIAILLIAAVALISLPQHASSRISPVRRSAQQDPMAGMDHSSSETEVPAFHSNPPTGTLPETMDPALFVPDTLTANAYAAAARIRKILYQQPCYCHCDKSQGHTGLLDCFVSRHGSGCNICKSEAFYTFEQLHEGKTAAQIREGIIRGDWQNVNLAKYSSAPLPPAK